MTIWDRHRYEEEKRRFILRRIHNAPLWGQFTLLFGATWGAAWLCSWSLLRFAAGAHPWAGSLPIRYAIAFLFAYACFFLAVRIWIETVSQEPEQQGEGFEPRNIGTGGAGGDGEGCLFVIALVLVSFIAGGLFLFFGGTPLLLEAAFESAFAGVLVRRPLSGDLVLGSWKARTLQATWKPALATLLILVALAAWLQRQAPQARTFAEAVHAVASMEGASRTR